MLDRVKQSGNHKCDLFRLGILNVGTLRGRAGEIVEKLNQRKIDICCVQEARWRGASTRKVTGKNSQYKLFWIGNQTINGSDRIFITKKLIEKVLEVKRVSDRLMMIKLQTDKRTVAVSAYAPQQGLTKDEKDWLYESIIQLITSINDNDIVISGGDFKGHVRNEVDGYNSVHGS